MATKTPRLRKGRMNRRDWVEAEELYRMGTTQREIAEKYGVRIETVSRHMTMKGIKGGEASEAARSEVAARLARKQAAFSEKKADRQIEAKERLYSMTNALLMVFTQEFQNSVKAGHGLPALQGSAKALKDALTSMRLGREELYSVLDIEDTKLAAELPELVVSAMSMEEEKELRQRVTMNDDDDDEFKGSENHVTDVFEDVGELIARIEHEVEMEERRE